jgi:ribonuclease P/MRP protein subunit RPP1
MFFDLNVPVPQARQTHSKKGKGKNLQPANASAVVYTAAQISAIDTRVDLLVHCQSLRLSLGVYLSTCSRTVGYSVIAFNQKAYKRIEAKTHVNVLDDLINQLKKRPSVVFLKRLTIVLDEESEKGFGLVRQNHQYRC